MEPVFLLASLCVPSNEVFMLRNAYLSPAYVLMAAAGDFTALNAPYPYEWDFKLPSGKIYRAQMKYLPATPQGALRPLYKGVLCNPLS
ncbi:MAG TPA: hypothetical protein VN665_04340 [Candidatus Paceibacterota bacterium]|nr:hypothetical protein [Candidatus Paceibacterota bacterium]